MESPILQSLFLVLVAALVGGAFARFLRLPVLLGYILIGVLAGAFLPVDEASIEGLAEIGIVLLLFSVGIELQLSKLTKVGKVAVIGAILQMTIVFLVSYVILNILGIGTNVAMILSAGFTLSSTALVVKLLEERGETNTVHGDIMISWLLIQDLAVVPIMAVLPALTSDSSNLLGGIATSIVTSLLVVVVVLVMGRLVAPVFTRALAVTNSRELLVLGGVSMALGTAFVASMFGVPAALGAFLAGVVISETQEHHAIFAETRPLRDLFVILFFVSLGFFVTPSILASHFLLILVMALTILLLKGLVVLAILYFFKYRGRTLVSVGMGLSQIGEFSFVILLASKRSGILSSEASAIGIGVTLMTLITTPFVFKYMPWVFRKMRKYGVLLDKKVFRKSFKGKIRDHVIICGYGRMGMWIGKALALSNIPFVVIDYNQKVIDEARSKDIKVVFGDPIEPVVLDAAGLSMASCLVVAIPDQITQREVIGYAQNKTPKLTIYARANTGSDAQRLTEMKVEGVVQPEFEGSLVVVRKMLKSMGKLRRERKRSVKTLRRLHTMGKR